MSADEPRGQTLVEHLIELRSRLLRVVFVTLALFALLAPFANTLYALTAAPLMAALPAGASMIATEVASPFLAPFKLALFVALAIAMPYVLYQAWAFVAPGLYDRERRFAFPLLASSIVLFYAGIAFAYLVVFPLVFGFLTASAPEGVLVMTDIGHYLSFVLALFFAFGIAFQVPVATILLVRTGFTTPVQLAKKRPYVLVGAFVIGMFLTPPDVISQTLLAVPMYLLFEAGIVLSRWMVPGWKEVEAQRRGEIPGD
ncbi:MAG: twin-arginine translocase subunit TatC [Xanthomonadaceae bacterium]|nr:twin-arginine translocase subunit TatC [Xanthomonadaceae bacterium]